MESCDFYGNSTKFLYFYKNRKAQHKNGISRTKIIFQSKLRMDKWLFEQQVLVVVDATTVLTIPDLISLV